MHSQFFFALPVLAASLASGNPILERAACKQDNCVRGIVQTSTAYKPLLSARLTDCSKFMTTTVTPDVSTITVTSTATATSITTLHGALNRRSAITDFSPKPAYATWCVDTVAYSSGCSCAGITAATITAPAPSITVTATATATYTSTATPSATGFYLQANSADSAVNGQCAYFNPAGVGNNGESLTFIGSGSSVVPPTSFTLDSNGYLYSGGLQAMAYVGYCWEIQECGTQFIRGYTPAQIASESGLEPVVCTQTGTALNCSLTIQLNSDPFTFVHTGLQGPQQSGYMQGTFNPFFSNYNYGPPTVVSFAAVTDINQCSGLPSSTPVTTVTPSVALPSPFYLQAVTPGNIADGQCAFLANNAYEQRPNALSFLGTNGDNCGMPIPQFILDTSGHLTTTDLYQMGTYIACGSGLSNCGTRYVEGIPTANIPYYAAAYYPLICSYNANTSLLNCVFGAGENDFNYMPYEYGNGFYELNYGLNSGATSVTFRVIQDLGLCTAGC